MMYFSPELLHFCALKEATIGQAARVVVAHIDKRPEQMHEDFLFLAYDALARAWPCRTKQR